MCCYARKQAWPRSSEFGVFPIPLLKSFFFFHSGFRAAAASQAVREGQQHTHTRTAVSQSHSWATRAVVARRRRLRGRRRRELANPRSEASSTRGTPTCSTKTTRNWRRAAETPRRRESRTAPRTRLWATLGRGKSRTTCLEQGGSTAQSPDASSPTSRRSTDTTEPRSTSAR
ncbi:hypothetical protein NFJ02_12g11830 [Pycnococcus provasolii]